MAQDLQLRIRISADGRAAIEGTQQVERQVEKLGNTAGKVGALIAGYLSFQFLTGAVQELFKVQARLQDLQAQFQALAGERAADQFLYIQNAAQRLSMDLDGARSAYGKMLVMVDSGLLNIGQAQQMFEGLSAYARLAGASAEQVSNSMYGLSQALGQGRVQMTEVLQVTEPLPGSLNKIAAAAKMAVGEFRALIMDPAGPGVSSKQFGEWVQKAFGDAIPIAEQMAGTLSATWTRVKNDWRLFMEDMGSSSGFAEIAKTSLDGFSALLSGLDSPQFTNVARNFTAMFSSAISELFGVFQLLMDYIEELVMVYLGVKFVQAINIAVKAIEVYKTTVAAMMAQTTMQMTASQAAAIGLGAAIKASVAIIAPLLIIAAGAYLLLADNTDHAAVAQDAYNRVLQQTGGSLDELARKYKTLSDAQKATMTMQLSLDLKAQEDALKKLEADFKDTMERLRDNVASANGGMVFSGVNDAASNQLLNSMGFEQALTGDAEALAKFIKNVEDYKEAGGKLNVEIGNILFGHKNLLDMLKKSGIEFNKTKDSVDYTRDALDLVNGKLPQTASEFDKAGAAAQRAGKEFQDAINKDWSKLTSFGMNNAELAKVDAISQGATAAQQQLAVGLGTLKDQQEQLTAAIKTGKTELIDQAEQALRNAASLAIAAKGADAFGASMAGMQQDIAKGNLTQIEAARISNDAAEAEKQRAAVALDVEGMIQRARRESTKAGTEQIQELQETNQYLKLQQDLVNGVAVEWAGLKDLPAVLNSLQVDAGLPKKEAVDALVEYVKTYDSIPDKAQAAQAAQLALDNAIQNYTLNLKDTNAEEAKRSEELARQTELMMFQKQATDSLISAGSAQLSYTVADTEMKATVSSLEQIEEFYRRIGELQKEMAEGATDQRLKEMMSGFDNESVAAIDKLTVGLIAERDELKKHAPTWAELTGEVNDNTAVKETNAALTKILPTLLNDESVAREANAKTVAAEVDALKKINAAQQLAADGYTASLTPMEKYQAEIKNIAAAAKTLAERKDLGLISPEQLEKEQRGLQALTLEAEKTVNLTAQLFEDAAGSIAGEWNNMFEQLFTGNKDAFKDFANSLKDIFLKMLAQMAAAALAGWIRA